jgi:hypothetical protein
LGLGCAKTTVRDTKPCPQRRRLSIIAKFNAVVIEASSDSVVRSRILEFGSEIFPRDQQTPEGLAALQKSERREMVANHEGGRDQSGMSQGCGLHACNQMPD